MKAKHIALMADLGERLLLVALAVPWLIAFVRFLPRDPGLVTAILSEGAMVVFILIRKPGQIAMTPYAFTIGFLGTCFALFVRPVQTTVVTTFSQAVMMFGFLLSLSSKLALNRRFGIVAANRGVQTKWPYSIVRHPMYAGYVITQVGFFITSPTLWNGFVYAVAWSLQVMRIFEEEKLLRQDATYAAFTQRVRYRLVPGLF